jgi:hypothetical protein
VTVDAYDRRSVAASVALRTLLASQLGGLGTGAAIGLTLGAFVSLPATAIFAVVGGVVGGIAGIGLSVVATPVLTLSAVVFATPYTNRWVALLSVRLPALLLAAATAHLVLRSVVFDAVVLPPAWFLGGLTVREVIRNAEHAKLPTHTSLPEDVDASG